MQCAVRQILTVDRLALGDAMPAHVETQNMTLDATSTFSGLPAAGSPILHVTSHPQTLSGLLANCLPAYPIGVLTAAAVVAVCVMCQMPGDAFPGGRVPCVLFLCHTDTRTTKV